MHDGCTEYNKKQTQTVELSAVQVQFSLSVCQFSEGFYLTLFLFKQKKQNKIKQNKTRQQNK